MKLSRLAAPLFTLLLALMLAAVFSFNAEARRMGGGKSFGRQSNHVTQRQATPPPAAPNTAHTGAAGSAANNPGATSAAAARAGTAGAAGAAARKPWAGMLGAAAAGLGLAWLAHSLGLGAEFGNILLIALLAFAALAAFRWLRRSQAGGAGGARRPAFQGANAAGGAGQFTRFQQAAPQAPQDVTPAAPAAPAAGSSAASAVLAGPQTWGIPSHFDVVGFTDVAKRNFRRLQEAHDRADLTTLRSMLSPEMLEEISRQIAEREPTPGKVYRTEIESLDAQLLGIEEQDGLYLASVEFSGSLREDGAAFAAPFREVWNMSMPQDGSSGWRVAGIQVAE